MALHLTSLGDQEARGKMCDNCGIYQENELLQLNSFNGTKAHIMKAALLYEKPFDPSSLLALDSRSTLEVLQDLVFGTVQQQANGNVLSFLYVSHNLAVKCHVRSGWRVPGEPQVEGAADTQ